MATTFVTPMSAASQRETTSFATRLLLVYIFMLYSRFFEAAMAWGAPNLYVMLILSAAALALVLFKGGFVHAAIQPLGVLFCLFTGWAALTLPFSDWKSESFHQLTGVWLKSVAAYFIIVGLIRTFSDLKKTFNVFGWAAAVSALVMAVTNRIIGQRMTSVGSLGNSNEAAFHIIFGLPFIILLIQRTKPIFRLPLAAIALLSLGLSVKTASRAGLLMAGILTIVALLKVSPANKVKILAIAALAGVVGLLAIDKIALERYKTMFDSSDNSVEAESARESAFNREYLLREGIHLTFEHPVFGVGMGVFPSAAAELSKSRGEHPLWLVSHNSYVQVSSEMGFIGLFLMIAIFLTCFGVILKLERTGKRLGIGELRSMAFCLLLSFIALSIDYFFDAAAYDVYLPMAAGLCTALAFTTRPLIIEAEQRLASGNTGRDPALEQLAKPAVLTPSFAPQGSYRSKTSSGSTLSEERPAARGKNPFRFGRRRVSQR